MHPDKPILVKSGIHEAGVFGEKGADKRGNADDRADMMRMGKVQELRVRSRLLLIPRHRREKTNRSRETSTLCQYSDFP